MPPTETPPNSAPPTPPTKVRTGRFGELDEHELIHLLDSLDDERSKARFRESIYISFIVYLFIAWFLFYGPRVIFHQPRLISPVDVLKERDRQLTYLNTPTNLPKLKSQKSPKNLKEQPQPRPTLDKKTLDQLRRSAPPAPAAAPAPAAPSTPPPPPQQTQQQTPLPPPPQQQPQQLADAPRPTIAPTKPNFSTPNQSAGDAIRQAAENAARNHSAGGYSDSPSGGSQGSALGTGVEVLSDIQDADINPYLRRLLADIKRNWLPLIPEEARPPLNKQGETLIRFTIMPDGSIKATKDGMILEASTQDASIDRAAWGAIKATNPFHPLPSGSHGQLPMLELRINFLVNKTPPGQ